MVSAYHVMITNTHESNPNISRIGFNAGLFGEFYKIKTFSLNFEIDFIQKGGDNGGNDYSTLNLISVPLSAKFTLDIIKDRSVFYFLLGPRVDILLSKKESLHLPGEYLHVNPVNFGMSVSMGTEIRISKKNSLLFEAGFSPDISTYPAQFGNLLTTYNIRNISFEFKTGLKFNRL
jgi:hypothetical protein